MNSPQAPPPDFLVFGLILGFGAGMAVAKHTHAVELVIAGPILGVLFGIYLEHRWRRAAGSGDDTRHKEPESHGREGGEH